MERCVLCRRQLAKRKPDEALWFLTDGRLVHLDCLQRETVHLDVAKVIAENQSTPKKGKRE